MEYLKIHTRVSGPLNAVLYGSSLPEQSPLVLYMHGFKGFKEWGFVPFTGNYFASRGMRFLAFDFSHNGTGDVPGTFTEPEKFRDNTFSRELAEALEVIQEYSGGGPPGVLGHSRGGGIALLAGARNPHVKAVATWAAVSTFRRYPTEIIERWKRDGYLEVTNTRTGQVMQLGYGLHEDLLRNIDGSLNIRAAVENATSPLCFIHATGDEAVEVQDACNLFEWAGDEKARIMLPEGSGHTFGIKHPFDGSNTIFDRVLETTFDFFASSFNLPDLRF